MGIHRRFSSCQRCTFSDWTVPWACILLATALAAIASPGLHRGIAENSDSCDKSLSLVEGFVSGCSTTLSSLCNGSSTERFDRARTWKGVVLEIFIIIVCCCRMCEFGAKSFSLRYGNSQWTHLASQDEHLNQYNVCVIFDKNCFIWQIYFFIHCFRVVPPNLVYSSRSRANEQKLRAPGDAWTPLSSCGLKAPIAWHHSNQVRMIHGSCIWWFLIQ